MRAAFVLPLAVLVAAAVAITVVGGIVALLGFVAIAALGCAVAVWLVGWEDLQRAARRR